MKKYIISLLVLGFTASAWSQELLIRLASKEGGGGGEIEAQWFANHAILVTNYYVGLCSKPKGDELIAEELPGITCGDFQAIREVYRNVAIEFQEKVYGADGRERDAINNGHDKITVGLDRWKAMKSQDVTRRIRIALHEYATIATLESSDSYGFSGSVAGQLLSTSPVQAMIDRVRFSPEYFSNMENSQACALAAGFPANRVSALFGSCAVRHSRRSHWVYLNGQAIWYSSGSMDGDGRENGCGREFKQLMSEGMCY